MHKNSLRIMRYFIRHYVGNHENLKVLDVGSRTINSRRLGSYRNLFEDDKYIGVDIVAGENVDIVTREYEFPFKDEEFDIVISGSTFEHVEWPWILIKEIVRVLKRDGLCCIVAPWNGDIHQFPVDTYRYFPDAMSALAKWSELKVLRVGRLSGDSYLMAKK